MCDAFAYRSVLLSIILGLAIAEVLQPFGLLLVSRAGSSGCTRPRVHEAIAPLMATVIILFFATVFARL